MIEKSLRIHVDAETRVSARWLGRQNDGSRQEALLVLAHGAGNDMENPFISFVHERVAALGIATLKFNFPYKEIGRKAPDPAPRLEATWRSILHRAQTDPAIRAGKIFAGGKSLGGRVASQVVAGGEDVAGLVFLGYPLHPPGRQDKPRTAHFSNLRVPALFVQGTRDTLCDLEMLRESLASVPGRTTLHLVDGGEHSFKLPKRYGISQETVWETIAVAVVNWVSTQL